VNLEGKTISSTNIVIAVLLLIRIRGTPTSFDIPPNKTTKK
jgi:hypothetical protein